MQILQIDCRATAVLSSTLPLFKHRTIAHAGKGNDIQELVYQGSPIYKDIVLLQSQVVVRCEVEGTVLSGNMRT